MNQYCQNCGTRLNGEAYCPKCQRPTSAVPSPGPFYRTQGHSLAPISEKSAKVNRQGGNLSHSDGKGKIMKAYSCAFQNYTNFSGRATRAEYWWLQLVILLFYVSGVICFGTGIEYDFLVLIVLGGMLLVAALVFLSPLVSCAVRRLHDTGRSGWFLLLSLIVPFGLIPLLVMLLLPSQAGENKYGRAPLAF